MVLAMKTEDIEKLFIKYATSWDEWVGECMNKEDFIKAVNEILSITKVDD